MFFPCRKTYGAHDSDNVRLSLLACILQENRLYGIIAIKNKV